MVNSAKFDRNGTRYLMVHKKTAGTLAVTVLIRTLAPTLYILYHTSSCVSLSLSQPDMARTGTDPSFFLSLDLSLSRRCFSRLQLTVDHDMFVKPSHRRAEWYRMKSPEPPSRRNRHYFPVRPSIRDEMVFEVEVTGFAQIRYVPAGTERDS